MTAELAWILLVAIVLGVSTVIAAVLWAVKGNDK